MLKSNPKISSEYRGTQTEIEFHRYAAMSEKPGVYSGVELIIDQAPEGARRKMTTVPLPWDKMIEMHAILHVMIQEGRKF